MSQKIVKRDLMQLKEAWDGIDFIVELSVESSNFPRTLLTGASRKPHIVNSRDEAMTYIESALYEDCYISAYLNRERMAQGGLITPPLHQVPNYIVIDLDRKDFESDADLEAALNTTLQNIKDNFTGCITENPIVIWSGNGYHIHIPLPGFQTPLEDMPEFAAFKDDKDLPNKFLRWAEDTLTNNKADQHHNQSINSSLFRIPGTINTKARAAGKDPHARVVQGFKYINKMIAQDYGLPDFASHNGLSKPKQKFLNDFLGYLIQERIDDKVELLQRRKYHLIQVGDNNNNNNGIAWIDRLLETGVGDNRKNLIFWVLAPYLITVRNIEYDKAYHIIEAWLEKCEQVRRLEPGWKAFSYRIIYCLDSAEDQQRKPIRFETFKEYYPYLWETLKLTGGA